MNLKKFTNSMDGKDIYINIENVNSVRERKKFDGECPDSAITAVSEITFLGGWTISVLGSAENTINRLV